MSTARHWHLATDARGPFAASHDDIPALNQVFSDAFTERYRRDGMVGVRVPQLNPGIWRYAVEDAAGGALVWRGDRDEIVAFNIAHRSGSEGWMGPLAVRPEWQGSGLGKIVVRSGVDWLREGNAMVIGLETMPRTMDNIGFYSGLGFLPMRLTFTLTLDAAAADGPVTLLGRLPAGLRDDMVAACRRLAHEEIPGFDFTREINLTAELGLGDTVLLERGGVLSGFALFHSAPLVEGRARDELRVLKLVLRREDEIDEMARLLCLAARRTGSRRVAIRVQGAYLGAYARLIALGARVRWTDLRMTVAGYPEPQAKNGVVFSNWEI
ncbi:MAG TPA: GNAT family N-acetyltransferase [Gemmatimonadaceae bacterium]|nr:GNAT family N-acetyltransferase [Gemmatimonadaceae bacterium]